MQTLVVGCGYVGLELGARLARAGHRVTGIRRPTSDPSPLQKAGIAPWLTDLTLPGSIELLPAGWDWIVHCAAPSRSGTESYRAIYHDAIRHLLKRFGLQAPGKFVFTSSTSVYGQKDGSEVDESSLASPLTETGRILRDTEALLLSAADQGFPAVILRVAGIYGPGRNRLINDAQGRRRARSSEGSERWLNLVHRDDVVTAIQAALERGRPGEIYNVSDDHPVREHELNRWLAERTGTGPLIAENQAALPPTSRSTTNRRIRAGKLRDELGWMPHYVDYRSGYEAELG